MGINNLIVSTPQLFFTKLWEGAVRDEHTKLHASYKDEIGTGQPWTIGYGHTEQSGVMVRGVVDGKPYEGEAVVPRLLITDAEAERLLAISMERRASIVREAVQVDVSQSMFDALCDLAHNAGAAPFRKGSDLLAALNGGLDDNGLRIGPQDYARAQLELLRWKKSGGKARKGLYRRRLANACYWAGLPWQWIYYDANVDMDVSLGEAIVRANRSEEVPQEDLPERSTWVAITQPVLELAEQETARQQAKAEKVNKKPPVVRTKPPSAYTRKPEQVTYKIDPNAGLKPLEESSRAHGYVWQQIGVVFLRIGGALGIGGASAVSADPTLANALLALFVVAGVGVTGFVIKAYGDWKRQKGEEEASQGLY